MINYIKYIYGSQKGNIERGGDISSPMGHHRDEYTYSSEVVEEETISESTSNTYTSVNLAYTPIRPGTVSITSEAPGDITDDGDGNLVGNVTGPATINYETGEMTFTVDGTAAEVTVNYEFNLEYVPSTIPQVDIKIESLPVIARGRKLRALKIA